MTFALRVAVLTGVYALTLASVDPFDLALGALLAVASLLALRRFLEPHGASTGELAKRVARFPAFAAAVAVDIVRGTWEVALAILGVRPPTGAGIVRVPIEERTANGVAISALTATMSPGEVLVEIDWEARVMLIHVLDATDATAICAGHRRFYYRYQRGVFP